MTEQADDARDLLRSVWRANDADRSTALDDEVSPTTVCKNMQDVTFDGYAEPGCDLGSAWRDLLAREGKLDRSGQSIRDLVMRPSDPT